MQRKLRRPILRTAVLLLLLWLTACNLTATAEPIAPGETPLSDADTTAPAATDTGSVAPADTQAPTDTTVVPTDTPAPPTATPEPIIYPLGPTGFPANVNPLTGLAVANPGLLNRRPLAIKVSNFPRSARPQAGLSLADIVFEWYTEHGSTRFMALFYGTDSNKVGPIRSVRIQDFDVVSFFSGILVHVAGYEPVIAQMNLRGIDAISELGMHSAPGDALWRDTTVPLDVNQVFANTVKLTEYAKRVEIDTGRPTLDGMLFDPAPPADAKDSIGMRIKFSKAAITQWKYDSASQRYLRFSENEAGVLVPLLDSVPGTQVATDNVLVLYVPWTRFPVIEAGKMVDNEMWQFNFTGSGKAFFFRDGKVVQGLWQNGGAGVPLRYVDKNGDPFALKPGQTYIAVIPSLSSGGATASTEYQFNGYP